MDCWSSRSMAYEWNCLWGCANFPQHRQSLKNLPPKYHLSFRNRRHSIDPDTPVHFHILLSHRTHHLSLEDTECDCTEVYVWRQQSVYHWKKYKIQLLWAKLVWQNVCHVLNRMEGPMLLLQRPNVHWFYNCVRCNFGVALDLREAQYHGRMHRRKSWLRIYGKFFYFINRMEMNLKQIITIRARLSHRSMCFQN